MLPQIEELVKLLDNEYNQEKPLITLSSIYRLLRYHQMFRDYREKGNIEGLRYRSLLAYDLERNLIHRGEKGERDGKAEQAHRLRDKILEYFDESAGREKGLINFLKIPLFWLLLKNRRKIPLKEGEKKNDQA